MSYNDDAVLSKLSALNETQEAIVTVSQWVMFHRYCSRMKAIANVPGAMQDEPQNSG